jgi:hypothetical protein
MKNGHALYAAYQKGASSNPQIEDIKNKISVFCEFPYKAYVVRSDIYFIGESPLAGGIVFGRHFKISNGSVVKSTKTCYVTPPPPSNALAAFITHLLSETPTEFHVFLSLLHGNPIFVGINKEVWKVENGVITYTKKKE